MLKLILLAVCLAVAFAMPQPGLNYKMDEDTTRVLGESSPEILQMNDQQMGWWPWITVRTFGRTKGTDSLDTYTRGDIGWFGINLFGDFSTSKEKNAEAFGVGGVLGRLAKVYYSKDVKSSDHVIEWEGGI